MTEDFAYSHGSTKDKCAPGYVGVPYPGVKARIAPDGEILVKSPGQLVGYFKRPDLDAESFTEDGFFRTGDLGEYNADGLLKITGRKKDLFKTTKGKYVAPAPIEHLLNVHPMVELSLVSGVELPSAYAMLVLAEDLRSKLGDAAVRQQVEKELSKLLESVNRELPPHEHLRMLVVAREPWTPAALALLHEAALEAQKLYPEFHDPDAPGPTNRPTPPRGAYFVAFAATQPVGMGAHQPLEHETSEVRRMFVAREARNQGVARAILMNIEDHARLQGFRRLVLETGSRQLAAIRLY